MDPLARKSSTGNEASKGAARFRALSGPPLSYEWKRSRTFVVLALLLAGVASILAPPLLALPPAVVPIVSLMVFLALYALPIRVEIGSDGVLLRGVGSKRFISANEIEGASSYEDGPHMGVRIALSNGRELKLPMSGATRAAVVSRIKAVVANHDRGGTETASALLARGQRPRGRWIQGLRALGIGSVATLRTAAVDTKRLWKVLESSRAEPEDRVAAAIALAASEEPGSRERIRIAADAIAEPKLRVAVAAASHDDEAALHSALDSLDEEHARTSPR